MQLHMTLPGVSLVAKTLVSSINYCQITNVGLLSGFNTTDYKNTTWDQVKSFLISNGVLAYGKSLSITRDNNILTFGIDIPKEIKILKPITGIIVIAMGNIESNLENVYVQTTSQTETVFALSTFPGKEKPNWRSLQFGVKLDVLGSNF